MPDRAAPSAVTTPSIPALGGFRIIETAETPAGEYCGKLLADFGAEVVKIERPGSGAPTRDAAPRIAGVNPGFVMDRLVAVAGQACGPVRHATVTRVVDARTRREALQRKVGAGLSEDETTARMMEVAAHG